MLLPTVVIQCSGNGTECTGELRWRETRERPMHAMAVVVIPEGLQLLRQIDRVPCQPPRHIRYSPPDLLP